MTLQALVQSFSLWTQISAKENGLWQSINNDPIWPTGKTKPAAIDGSNTTTEPNTYTETQAAELPFISLCRRSRPVLLFYLCLHFIVCSFANLFGRNRYLFLFTILNTQLLNESSSICSIFTLHFLSPTLGHLFNSLLEGLAI